MIAAPFPCTEWEKLPLVRLAILLQQQPGFNAIKWDAECKKEQWISISKTEWPSILKITKPYKTREVKINVSLDEHTYHIVVWDVQRRTPNGRHRWKSKGRDFDTYADAIEQIGLEYQKACVELEPEIQEEERYKREKEELERIRIATADKLGVTLTTCHYRNVTWNYREGMVFRLSIERVQMDGEELFRISNIGGTYTLDELKTIMQIVALNSRAIAERLHA